LRGSTGFERSSGRPWLVGRRRKARKRRLATISFLLALPVWSCQDRTPAIDTEIVFEREARPLVSGQHRDPQLAVRASGAIVLAVVASEERGVADLDLHLSHSGGDVFEKSFRINREPGSVMSHPEGSPVLLMGPRSRFHAFWLSEAGRGARVIRTSVSKDFLNSFETPTNVITGERGTPAFFSAEVSAKGDVLVAWLGHHPGGESIPGTAHLLVSRSQDGGRLPLLPPRDRRRSRWRLDRGLARRRCGERSPYPSGLLQRRWQPLGALAAATLARLADQWLSPLRACNRASRRCSSYRVVQRGRGSAGASHHISPGGRRRIHEIAANRVRCEGCEPSVARRRGRQALRRISGPSARGTRRLGKNWSPSEGASWGWSGHDRQLAERGGCGVLSDDHRSPCRSIVGWLDRNE